MDCGELHNPAPCSLLPVNYCHDLSLQHAPRLCSDGVRDQIASTPGENQQPPLGCRSGSQNWCSFVRPQPLLSFFFFGLETGTCWGTTSDWGIGGRETLNANAETKSSHIRDHLHSYQCFLRKCNHQKRWRGPQVYGLRHSNIGMQRDHLTGITGLVTLQICRKLWSWSGYPSLTLAGELIHWLLTLIIFTILSNYQIQCKVRTPIRAFNCQRHFPDFIAVPNNLALIMIPSNPSSTKRRKIK